MAKKPQRRSSPSAHSAPNAVITAAQSVNQYQGPIPPPEILRGFDNLVPGTAERLIKLAEDESIHRRGLESRALQANIDSQAAQNSLQESQSKAIYISDLIGQLSGLFVCVICICSATYLGINDHEWLGGAIAAVPTGALIKAFIMNKK